MRRRQQFLAAAISLAMTLVLFVPTVTFAMDVPAAEAANETNTAELTAAVDSGSGYRACEHTYSYVLQEDSYEATDTEGGYRHYVCSECKAEYAYETAPMIYEANPKTGEPVTHQGASNPIYENWCFIPDGEPHVFWSRDDEEWRVYVYGSHDEDGITMCGYDQLLWSAPVYDMSQWRYEGVILEFHDIDNPVKLYAPDCDYDVQTDTYYMIANQAAPDNKSVLRAADNPAGPWNPEENLIEMRMRLAYDPAIYIEDGNLYILGSAMKSGAEDAGREDILAAFEEDNYKIKHLLSVSRLKGNANNGFEVDETVFPASDEKCYLAIYEGPSFTGWVEELGAYVILYVSQEPGEEENYNSTISYVYADDVMSDVWHYGDNGVDDIVPYDGEETLSGNHGNVIYDTSGRYYRDPLTGGMAFADIPVMMNGNNHGGICRINGEWYAFGHSPASNGGAFRRGVADRMNLTMKEDGTPLIEAVEFTSSGVSEYLDASQIWNANTTCYLVAGVGIPAAKGGEGQETVEGFDQPYIETTHDPETTHAAYVTDLKDSSVAGYKYIGFGDAADRTFKMLVRRDDSMAEGSVQIYLDAPNEEQGGTLAGTLEITENAYQAGDAETASDGSEWHWISDALDAPVEGIHAVYLVFGSDGDGYICDFDQFTFAAEE
ncbi:MAG: carbohydrate-binding protein [Parasporobacterium sp.]|nr:carbohydrate-binding protein [Parasporobacterium sp.]